MPLFIDDGHTGRGCIAGLESAGIPVVGVMYRPANGRETAKFLKARKVADDMANVAMWQALGEKFIADRVTAWWEWELIPAKDGSPEKWVTKQIKREINEESVAALPQLLQRELIDLIGRFRVSDPAPDGSKVGFIDPDESEKN